MAANISHNTRLQIVELSKEGFSGRAISRYLAEKNVKIHHSTAAYWVQKYQTGLFGDIDVPLPVKQRRFASASEADRETVTQQYLVKENTFSSRQMQRELKKSGSKISLSTTKRVIAACGLTNKGIRYGQMVRDANKIKRVAFCQGLLAANEKFDDVIFSDECSVQLMPNKITSYRPVGTLCQTIPKPKHPLKVHVWGAISKRGPSPLLIFEGIMDAKFFTENILGNVLLPFIRHNFPDGHRFQQDNDPKHTSRRAKTFMVEQGINWWQEWPSESPDLNPIEMVWNQMKRFIGQRGPQTKEELIQSIQTFWAEKMTPDVCRKYIEHNFKVVPVCIHLGGAATGDNPKKLFKTEQSLGKDIAFFQRKLKDTIS